MSQKNKKPRQSLPPMDFNPLMMMFSQWQQQMDPKPSTSSSTVTSEVKKSVGSAVPSLKATKKRRRSKNAATMMTKRAADMKAIVTSYPPISIQYYVAFQEVNECAKCRIYVGQFALVPCGHGKYCAKCVSELKKKSELVMIPGTCFNKSCYSIITSWFVLNKIN